MSNEIHELLIENMKKEEELQQKYRELLQEIRDNKEENQKNIMDLKEYIHNLELEIKRNNHIKEDVQKNAEIISNLIEQTAEIRGAKHARNNQEKLDLSKQEIKIEKWHVILAVLALISSGIFSFLGLIM